jgi:hypothetical protein
MIVFSNKMRYQIRLFLKFVIVFVWIGVLFGDEHSEKQVSDGIEFKYSYGSVFLIPSLEVNSGLGYNHAKNYSTLSFKWEKTISQKLRYIGHLELTDKPHSLIGTKFSRSDFPLSTGRFQESKVTYISKHFLFEIGRTNFLEENYRSSVFISPINGDGISWVYKREGMAFKHVLESLPAQKSNNAVFRRLLSYHHLTYRFGSALVGIGEYFILTGDPIGMDLKRLNPFLPFSLNSYDSEADVYLGYNGDSDNTLIKLFLDWYGSSFSMNMNLYIDEFHIDADDRKTKSDAILLNINVQDTFQINSTSNISATVEGAISISNPNFGGHPGPFTSATSAGYPLLEYSPGMLSLSYFKAKIRTSSLGLFSLSIHRERWVEISSITPHLQNIRSAIETLPVHKDVTVMAGYELDLTRFNSKILFTGWQSSDLNNSGLLVSISTRYPF